jgi:hypothetical protein
MYLESFTRENVLRNIRENGVFQMRYRLMFGDTPKPVVLRIALVREGGREKLIAGVREWRERK